MIVINPGSEFGTGGRSSTPQEVLRGGEWLDVAVSGVGLDWIRVVHSGGADACSLVEEFFGGPLVEADRSTVQFYRKGWRGPGGIVQGRDHISGSGSSGSGSVCLSIPGGVLSGLDADRRVALLGRLLAEGWRCTRLDVALDIEGTRVGLVEAVRSGCSRDPAVDTLTGASRVQSTDGYSRVGVFEDMVRIGGRGNMGSGRFIRVYDKGLEQGGVAGRWHRWEVEYSGEVACELAERLVVAGGSWSEVALDQVLSAVDFREPGGDGHLDRRLRCEWWQWFIDFVGGRVVERIRRDWRRRAPSVVDACAWIRRQVAPVMVGLSRELGVRVDDFARMVCGGVGVPFGWEQRTCAVQARQLAVGGNVRRLGAMVRRC